jgi:hypothetical protein
VIRALLLILALGLIGVGSFQLAAETRYRLLASRSVAELLLAADAGAGTTVMIFQPEDCFGDGAALRHWASVHEELGVPLRLLIAGTAGLSEPQELLLAELGLSASRIHEREAGVVAERLGHGQTPFLVSFDRLGRVTATFTIEEAVPAGVLASVFGT